MCAVCQWIVCIVGGVDDVYYVLLCCFCGVRGVLGGWVGGGWGGWGGGGRGGKAPPLPHLKSAYDSPALTLDTSAPRHCPLFPLHLDKP